MCNDMRRFERMAEEKRRQKNEEGIEFIIAKSEQIAVTSETKAKETQTKNSS